MVGCYKAESRRKAVGVPCAMNNVSTMHCRISRVGANWLHKNVKFTALRCMSFFRNWDAGPLKIESLSRVEMGGIWSRNQPPPSTDAAPSSGGCPVVRKTAAPVQGDVCPVKYKNQAVYNVYGEKLDPTNLMPATAQQLPTPDQPIPLPTHRVVSGIAKGGTDSTWVYPSEQMFYNSLKRKGKGDDVTPEDVLKMVAIHNNMNEQTWHQVLFWERFHCTKCDDPRLLRFTGRPDELSPTARIYTLMGYKGPFDRHDWIVDRCGTEVRYIIDYYHDPKLPVDQALPAQHDLSAKTQIILEVRPALDSSTAAFDRLRMLLLRGLGGQPAAPAGWPAPPPPPPPAQAPPPPKEWSKAQKRFLESMRRIETSCQSQIQALKARSGAGWGAGGGPPREGDGDCGTLHDPHDPYPWNHGALLERVAQEGRPLRGITLESNPSSLQGRARRRSMGREGGRGQRLQRRRGRWRNRPALGECGAAALHCDSGARLLRSRPLRSRLSRLRR
jgi:cytochrome c heme-lyase